MNIGFVSAVLGNWNYEKMMQFAGKEGFQCVEVASWPHEKAERRYAGVSHIDAERVLTDDDYCKSVINISMTNHVAISALAYYPNTMDGDLNKRTKNINHLKNVIQASHKLGIDMVTTFIGRDQNKTIESNLELVKEIWPEIIKCAEANNVRIAIENCPMLFGKEQWPGGQNIMTSPVIWREVFKILPSDIIGLNYDPSHFVWQQMDYISPIYEFKDKLFHVHFKDIKIEKKKLEQCGILAYPLDYMVPKIPGLGDIDWGKFVSALTDIGYHGNACIEIEDRSFEETEEDIKNSIILSKRYLSQFII